MKQSNVKRIHKVVVKRMVDESPDTSWLGEYSNSPENEYSIDRKHSLDCPINTHDNDAAQNSDTHNIDLAYARQTGGTCADCGATVDECVSRRCPYAEDKCDCDACGDMERSQYRYFNGNVENYKGESPKDTRKYVRQDYERMEQLNAGDWGFIGIRVDAEYQLTDVCQTMTSGGCWGIESDSGADYLKSIEDEELGQLREQLHAIGFSQRAISAAFKNVEREEGR